MASPDVKDSLDSQDLKACLEILGLQEDKETKVTLVNLDSKVARVIQAVSETLASQDPRDQ